MRRGREAGSEEKFPTKEPLGCAHSRQMHIRVGAMASNRSRPEHGSHGEAASLSFGYFFSYINMSRF